MLDYFLILCKKQTPLSLTSEPQPQDFSDGRFSDSGSLPNGYLSDKNK